VSIKKKGGFTLIETVMVLAIAGLILVVVFLAVGGAQRANRDTARVNEAGQVAAQMEAYARDHDGTYPTSQTMAANYLDTVHDQDVAHPSYTTGNGPATSTSGVIVRSGVVCNTSSGATSGTFATGTTRNYAISYWSEQGNAAACKDNR